MQTVVDGVDNPRSLVFDARGDLYVALPGDLPAGRSLDEDAAIEYATRAPGARRRPTVGWAALTPTETEVARLAAEGLTNREIAARLLVGAETVKTHLGRVYDKVGVRTRAALAAAHARREPH